LESCCLRSGVEAEGGNSANHAARSFAPQQKAANHLPYSIVLPVKEKIYILAIQIKTPTQ
jgi:hypothetical protein